MKGYYDEENEEFIETGEKYSALQIMALDSDSFKRYVNKIGAKYDKVKDKEFGKVLDVEFNKYKDD